MEARSCWFKVGAGVLGASRGGLSKDGSWTGRRGLGVAPAPGPEIGVALWLLAPRRPMFYTMVCRKFPESFDCQLRVRRKLSSCPLKSIRFRRFIWFDCSCWKLPESCVTAEPGYFCTVSCSAPPTSALRSWASPGIFLSCEICWGFREARSRGSSLSRSAWADGLCALCRKGPCRETYRMRAAMPVSTSLSS